jgi:hypothetical protein
VLPQNGLRLWKQQRRVYLWNSWTDAITTTSHTTNATGAHQP